MSKTSFQVWYVVFVCVILLIRSIYGDIIVVANIAYISMTIHQTRDDDDDDDDNDNNNNNNVDKSEKSELWMLVMSIIHVIFPLSSATNLIVRWPEKSVWKKRSNCSFKIRLMGISET